MSWAALTWPSRTRLVWNGPVVLKCWFPSLAWLRPLGGRRGAARLLERGMQAPPPSPYVPSEVTAAVDSSHLQLLAVFYYVKAGLCLMALFFVAVHCAIMMTVMGSVGPGNGVQASSGAHGGPMPQEAFLVAAGIYVFAFALIIAMGVCDLIAANSLRKRTRRTFTMVVAGFSCLSFPLGTALGVFTFIVLSRPSVQALYRQQA